MSLESDTKKLVGKFLQDVAMDVVSVLYNDQLSVTGYSFQTEEELKELIKKSGVKTWFEDPIPSQPFEPSLDIILPVLTRQPVTC